MPSFKPLPRPPKISVHGPEEAFGLLGKNSDRDAVVVVTPVPVPGDLLEHRKLARLSKAVGELTAVDEAMASGEPSVTLAGSGKLPGGRLVLSVTGHLDHFTDDVRAYGDAGEAGLKRAWKAGAKNPLIVVLAPDEPRYARAAEVALLGGLASLWRSVEGRTARPGKGPKVKSIGLLAAGTEGLEGFATTARAAELGRGLARDITGTEPEVMTPEAAATYVEEVFAKGPVEVTVERDPDVMRESYPMLWNVARGSLQVERYLPRVVRLEYAPPEDAERTVFLVGKGVVYDTGGHNIKVGPGMAGMSRDKGGAGAAAGVMRMVRELKPAKTRVVAFLGLVRNSVDAEAYVVDEVLTSRAGTRVRVGNTDAEGRLVLADLLAAASEEARGAPDPVLLTIATLTGHAQRTVGPYPILVENAPARDRGVGDLLERAGEAWGEPFERSRVRREDYEHVKARTDAEDVVSIDAHLIPSIQRGHQFPHAFLDLAAGLSKSKGRKASLPAYVHVDIAGSAVKGGDWAYGAPTASPVLPLYMGLVD